MLSCSLATSKDRILIQLMLKSEWILVEIFGTLSGTCERKNYHCVGPNYGRRFSREVFDNQVIIFFLGLLHRKVAIAVKFRLNCDELDISVWTEQLSSADGLGFRLELSCKFLVCFFKFRSDSRWASDVWWLNGGSSCLKMILVKSWRQRSTSSTF